MPVEVVHFNPRRRRRGRFGRFLPKRPLNNFGDLTGPLLVQQIVQERRLEQPAQFKRLVSVGSIMRLTQPGDVVWGAGVNGRSMDLGAAPDLDVRAVRGPLTRALLREAGAEAPECYGDPALLWPRFWPREYYDRGVSVGAPSRKWLVVPNHNDASMYVDAPNTVSPLAHPHDVIEQIVRSEFVCGSSLHGIILAEAFGIPARLIASGSEPDFKYNDYYQGTGRDGYRAAVSVEEALELGGEPAAEFDADALLAAFPADLYESADSL